MDTKTEQATQELVLERTFNAPRDLVFKVWTDPKHLAQWWGPKGFTSMVKTLELRPGGNLHITMTGLDGVVIPTKGVFHEIVESERLVFSTSGFEDEAGIPQLEVLNTVTLTEQNSKTTLTLKVVVTKSTPAVSGSLAHMEEGWNQSLDRLADALKNA